MFFLPNSRILEQGGRNPSRLIPPKIINFDSNMHDEWSDLGGGGLPCTATRIQLKSSTFKINVSPKYTSGSLSFLPPWIIKKLSS